MMELFSKILGLVIDASQEAGLASWLILALLIVVVFVAAGVAVFIRWLKSLLTPQAGDVAGEDNTIGSGSGAIRSGSGHGHAVNNIIIQNPTNIIIQNPTTASVNTPQPGNVADFEEKLNKRDNSGDDRLRAARQPLEAGDLDEADQKLAAIAEDKSKQQVITLVAEAERGRGIIAAQQIRWQDAASHFQRAAELQPSVNYLLMAWEYLRRTAHYPEAETLARKALKLAEEQHGENHPDTAAGYGNLATTLDYQGYYDKAEPLYRKALEISKNVLGENHPDTASSYDNLANNLGHQDKYPDAEPLHRKALEIRKNVLGEDHPDTATGYSNLACNLDQQDKHNDAEPLHRKALKIRRASLGEDHPETARSYSNVAYNLDRQGKSPEAEPLHRKVLRVWRAKLGEDHPDTAGGYKNLAANLFYQGKYGEAEKLAQKAVDIGLKRLGSDHPHTRIYQAALDYIRAEKPPPSR